MDEQKNIKFKKLYLLSLSFVSGLTIMAVEISASRLIAPYFGTSTYIWVNIIGVIMVALAIGYYFGGKLADKIPDLKVLLRLILAACVFLLITPFVTSYLAALVTKMLMATNSAAFIIFLGSLILVSLLLFVPIFLLGMVSPFIIKLLSVVDANIGQDAGLVFSISTLGSILGTFLPVLVFIPLIGTRKTIIIFTFFLVFVTLIGLLKKKLYPAPESNKNVVNKKEIIVVDSAFGAGFRHSKVKKILCLLSGKAHFLSLLILLLVFVKLPAYKQAQGAIYEDESVYQYFQVADENNMRYLKINEGMGVYSVINKDPKYVLTDSYFDYYSLLPYLDGNTKNQDVLILGLAGGTISTQLHHFFSQDYNLKIDGVEIDDKLIEVAKKYFNLENNSLTVHNLDGRIFLNYTEKKYNAIVVDAYANQMYIPFHLASEEFFQSVKGHLADQGLVAMNVNATSSDSALLKAITNTMNKVFAHVYILPLQNWNYLVLASDQQLDFADLDKVQLKELQPLATNAKLNYQEVYFDPKFQVLTDDKAPIEYLTDWMVLDYAMKN